MGSTKMISYIAYYITTLTNIIILEVQSRNEKKGKEFVSKLFLMFVLLVSNDINHCKKVKGKSFVMHCESSKAHIMLLYPIVPHKAYLDPIVHHAGNLSRLKKIDVTQLC